MFGSSVLEVIIGLVFVYFIMSLLCSALNEWVARIFAMRAKTLEAGILRLLSDDTALKEEIYKHPLVKTLSRQGWWQRMLSKIPGLGSSSGPSNLPARTFALVLSDILMEPGKEERSKSGKAASGATAASNDIDDKGKSTELQLAAREMLKDLEKGIEAQSGDVKQALQSLLNSVKAQTDQWDTAATAFRASMESWFDDTMDRVSGWYKRKAQLIILLLAVAACFALNVDTIVIANTLSNDATLRASLVTAAEARVQQAVLEDEESAPALDIEKYRDELSELGLPIGWSTEDGDPRSVPSSLPDWLLKSFGLLITAFAVSLGAPFWFDLLNRFVNLRASGGQPAKASKAKPGESTASSQT